MQLDQLKRREFITLLGGAAAWPVGARAQQSAAPVIGFLSPTSSTGLAALLPAFHRGLAEIGYVEQQNVHIEYRWADDELERLPALVADLVQRRVAVLTTVLATAAALSAKLATPTIPIIFAIGADPVKLDLVNSFNRPSGNITGVSFLSNALAAKMLEMLHEVTPNAKNICVLANPANPNTKFDTDDVLAAAASLGLHLHTVTAATTADFPPAFESIVQRPTDAVLVLPDAVFSAHAPRIAAFAASHHLPTIFARREAVEAGGLMSYGSSIRDALRQAGVYTGRILKGERPSDLPVVQPTRFELVINPQNGEGARPHGASNTARPRR
jgi:putative tryptophan/tyrosine transport system substrate-binding protein